MTEANQQPKSDEVSTAERLVTTGRSVLDAIAHQVRGDHETEEGVGSRVDLAEAERTIDDWPAAQRTVGRQILALYGAPNEATATKLSWFRNGAWKRTELSRDSVAHNWPAPHSDFLTQTIDYRVPPDSFDDIARFDGSVLLDRTRGEVSARCDSEAANVVSLNMVHEIVAGKRSVEEARRTLEQTKAAYTMGREAPYAERLLFAVPLRGTEDLDKTTMARAVVEQAVEKLKDTLR